MSKNTTSIKAEKHIYWKEQFTKKRESPDKSKNHKRQRLGGGEISRSIIDLLPFVA